MIYQFGKKPEESKNTVHVNVVINEPEQKEPEEVMIHVKDHEPEQKEESNLKDAKEIIQEADKLFSEFDEDVMNLAMIRDHMKDCLYAYAESPSDCNYESALKTLFLALDPVTDRLISDAGDQYERWRADCKKIFGEE